MPDVPVEVKMPTDDYLISKVNSEHPLPRTFKDSGIYVLQCSVNSFFELFFKDNSPFPFD
jgi:hypothetical protein